MSEGIQSYASWLPTDAVCQKVRFEKSNEGGLPVYIPIPPHFGHSVVKCNDADLSFHIEFITIPFSVSVSPDKLNDNSNLLDRLLGWASDGLAESERVYGPDGNRMQWMQFQNCYVVWSPRRIALICDGSKLESLTSVLMQFAFFDFMLRDLEQHILSRWTEVDLTIPAAHAAGKAIALKSPSFDRLCEDVSLYRSQLAKLSPYLYAPHHYPPTLASQIAERIRERTRMEYRHEYLDEQVEYFEQITENASQKRSDAKLAHVGFNLEWVIIILLIAQLLFTGFEIVAASVPTP